MAGLVFVAISWMVGALVGLVAFVALVLGYAGLAIRVTFETVGTQLAHAVTPRRHRHA